MVQLFVFAVGGLFYGVFAWGIALGDSHKNTLPCPPAPASHFVGVPSEIYQNTPFKAGESAIYEIRYAGILAGYNEMKVNPPIQYNGMWHQQFYMEVKTHEAFNNLYQMHDVMEAISVPSDFRIAKFYLKQDEKSLFSERFRQNKSLVFEHERCKVQETIQIHEKSEEIKEFDLVYGAKDSLGMLYYLRTLPLELNAPIRTLVYSSEKNWWLEAMPLLKENVTVPAGNFETTKLQLVTYLGKELQQQGDVYIWIAETPHRPLVMIQGELAIGSLWFELVEYEAGG